MRRENVFDKIQGLAVDLKIRFNTRKVTLVMNKLLRAAGQIAGQEFMYRTPEQMEFIRETLLNLRDAFEVLFDDYSTEGETERALRAVKHTAENLSLVTYKV